MKTQFLRWTAVAAALASAPVLAQNAIYPAKGQSAQQQQTDIAECGAWATQTTGVDPAAIASGQAQAQPQGGAGRGAARGAAAGAVGGAIAGDAGKGAAIGATVGGAGGAAKRRSSEKQQEASTQTAMTAYYNARTACLTGRGYSVK